MTMISKFKLGLRLQLIVSFVLVACGLWLTLFVSHSTSNPRERYNYPIGRTHKDKGRHKIYDISFI
jgi:hypothetical protein